MWIDNDDPKSLGWSIESNPGKDFAINEKEGESRTEQVHWNQWWWEVREVAVLYEQQSRGLSSHSRHEQIVRERQKTPGVHSFRRLKRLSWWTGDFIMESNIQRARVKQVRKGTNKGNLGVPLSFPVHSKEISRCKDEWWVRWRVPFIAFCHRAMRNDPSPGRPIKRWSVDWQVWWLRSPGVP